MWVATSYKQPFLPSSEGSQDCSLLYWSCLKNLISDILVLNIWHF